MDERMYKCAICGKQYTRIEDRINCESTCLKKRKEAEDKKKLAEMKEKQMASEKAIKDELAKVNLMIKEHLNKYDSFIINENYYYLSYIFGRRNFWF